LRPSEIREKLLPEYEKKHGYSKRTFDVLVIRELSKLGKLVKRKDIGHQHVSYSINKRGVEELGRIKVKNLTDSIDAKWLESLRRLLIRVKNEGQDPEAFLNSNCITFMEGMVSTFHKSMDGMQSHLAIEENLRKRHLRDLEEIREKFREEYYKADLTHKQKIEEKIEEEVGWTFGEYLKKLAKKADKQKGIRRIMTVLGITDEMLEEMYRERGQQERVYKKALHRILEKHHLDIEKPIKDRELLKTVLKEYDEWKKEYWKGDTHARISVEKRR